MAGGPHDGVLTLNIEAAEAIGQVSRKVGNRRVAAAVIGVGEAAEQRRCRS